MHKEYINWDANASFGLLPEVAEALKSYFGMTLNPSSIHSGGQKAKALIEEARHSILSLIGNPKDVRLIFTSGATESNNTIMQLPLWQSLERNFKFSEKSIAVSAYEHPSILEPAERLKNLGFKLIKLNEHDLSDFSKKVNSDCLLCSIMLANNETGQIYPRSQDTRISNVFMHSDAVQVLGKLPLNFDSLKVDALTLSAHKIGGLTGVGALVIKERSNYCPLLMGGAQELRQRAGTENVLGILAFGLAAKNAEKNLEDRTKKMLADKEFLSTKIKSMLPEAKILFSEQPSLPNTLAVHFPGLLADDLVVAMDLEHIFVSSGSACTSGKPLPSHVLLAQGFSEAQAKEVLRISLTGQDSASEIDQAILALSNSVKRMYLRAA